MMIARRDLYQRGAPDRRPELVGHVARQDGAQLAARDQGRRGDPIEQSPRVDRAPLGVAGRIEAVDPRPFALDHARRADVRQQGGIGVRLAWHQPKGLRSRFARGIGPQGALAAPAQAVEPVGRDHRTRIDDHERADTVRVPGRERHRVVAAHRVADERDARRAERVDEAEQIGGEILGRVRRRVGPLALAVAALIERDHVEAIGERRRDEVEPVRMRGAAVEETEHRAADDSPLEKVEPQPADRDGTLARGLAS